MQGMSKDNDSSSKTEESSKKRVITVSPCPPSVATGYMILRGAVTGLLGISPEDLVISILQPTYIKESIPSAKFSISCGKKYGSGQVQLPEDPMQQSAFVDLIEQTANRLIQEDIPIHLVQMTSPEEAQQAFGTSIFHQGNAINNQKTNKQSNNSNNKSMEKPLPVLVAHIPNIITCIPPAIPFASTACGISSISLDRKQSFVTAGKKAKKAEVVLKFIVTEKSDLLTSNTPTNIASIATQQWTIDSIPPSQFLLPEGQALYEQQQLQQHQQATPAAPASTMSTPQANTDNDTSTTNEAIQDNNLENNDTMVVNAFEVSGKIDYNKLVDKFGSKLIDADLMRRLEAVTVGRGRVPRLHRFLRRNIFFSHRDLNTLIDCIEQNRPIYLYTGRGPSSAAMHLGHLVPFLFTQWLQEALDCPLVIQMTDDEKFLFKGQYDDEEGDNLNHFRNLTIENARDIIACGFNFDKTFLFSDLDYVGTMYPNICRIWKAVTTNTVNGIFGFDGTSNIGKIAFPAIQAAPAFASSFPRVLQDAPTDTACLIPCAIDQDPYFRMTRDVAHKLVPKAKQITLNATPEQGQPKGQESSSAAATTAKLTSTTPFIPHALGGKPALIHSKFFPPLQGSEGKMSSSDSNSAVFLTDSPLEIETKIKQHAFSGGQESKQLQQELGADLDADVSYQWLRFFLEDDEELDAIGQSYSSGKGDYWSTGAVKKRLVQVLQELVAQHQERRAKITDEEIQKWMVERNILSL